MAKAAWIGLGVMGFPMAGHLLKKSDLELAVGTELAHDGARGELAHDLPAQHHLEPPTAHDVRRAVAVSLPEQPRPRNQKSRRLLLPCPTRAILQISTIFSHTTMTRKFRPLEEGARRKSARVASSSMDH